MGTGQSLPSENHALHALKRSSSRSSLKDRHLAEYPPLVIVKDASCQTTVSHLARPQLFYVDYNMIRKWIQVVLIALLMFVVVAIFSRSLQSLFLYMNILNVPLGSLTDLNRFGLHDARYHSIFCIF